MKLSVFLFGLFPLMTATTATTALAGADPGAPIVIKMKSLSYEPKQEEIKQGQWVLWKNTALTEHSAKSNDTPAAFDTGMIAPGKSSKAVHFETPGTFSYHCSLHGRTMSGVIVVTALPR